MIEVMVLVLADHVEQRGNKLDIWGISTGLATAGFPAQVASGTCVFVQLRGDALESGVEHELGMEISSEGGTVVSPQRAISFNFPSSRRKMSVYYNHIWHLEPITFRAPGIYQCSVWIDRQKAHTLPIAVFLQEP